MLFPSVYAHGRGGGYIPQKASQSLDVLYVDGISITTGNPCKQHFSTYIE